MYYHRIFQQWNTINSVLFFLVGNKDDEPERKVVPTSDAQKFAQQIDIPFFETSAKENKNVEEVGGAVWFQGLYSLL